MERCERRYLAGRLSADWYVGTGSVSMELGPVVQDGFFCSPS
jgi:hypothetical protein